jgi:uridine kinase
MQVNTTTLLSESIAAIEKVLEHHDRAIVAIDGRCAAGKTTLARELEEYFLCNTIHMDEFFLRPQQRTAERLAQPGGNIDHERFLTDVLLMLKKGLPFAYRPFDCHTMSLQKPISLIPTNLTIVEGSYSCHPELWDYYTLHIFLDIDEALQRQRILARNGADGLAAFNTRWIPMEERYFDAFDLRRRCEVYLKSE